MSVLVPPPHEVIEEFKRLYLQSPRKATDWYYKFSQDTDYIRRYRIEKDLRWQTATEYGLLDLSINLSKPEKDPKAIAAAKKAKQSGYPKCMLCPQMKGMQEELITLRAKITELFLLKSTEKAGIFNIRRTYITMNTALS